MWEDGGVIASKIPSCNLFPRILQLSTCMTESSWRANITLLLSQWVKYPSKDGLLQNQPEKERVFHLADTHRLIIILKLLVSLPDS